MYSNRMLPALFGQTAEASGRATKEAADKPAMLGRLLNVEVRRASRSATSPARHRLASPAHTASHRITPHHTASHRTIPLRRSGASSALARTRKFRTTACSAVLRAGASLGCNLRSRRLQPHMAEAAILCAQAAALCAQAATSCVQALLWTDRATSRAWARQERSEDTDQLLRQRAGRRRQRWRRRVWPGGRVVVVKPADAVQGAGEPAVAHSAHTGRRRSCGSGAGGGGRGAFPRGVGR